MWLTIIFFYKVLLWPISERFVFGPLMIRSQVASIVQKLWENEAQLCSFIGNIQGNQFHDYSKEGYNMFFIEAILVPPIKFRPDSKGGDSVSDRFIFRVSLTSFEA